MVFGGGSPLARPDDALVRRNRCLTFRRFAACGACRRARGCGAAMPVHVAAGTRMSSRARVRRTNCKYGGEACRGNRRGFEARGFPWRGRLPSRCVGPGFRGEGVDLAVEVRESGAEIVVDARRLCWRRQPSAFASARCLQAARRTRSSQRGRISAERQVRSSPRFSPPCRSGNCRLLAAPGDADRPAAADFLTAPARRPTLFE